MKAVSAVLIFAVAIIATALTAHAAPSSHNRFGVAITAGTATIQNTYNQLGLSWWYVYGLSTPSASPGHGVAHIAVNPANRIPVATLQAGALAVPGGSWLIGNEPNVPGQDNITPQQYATELNYYASTIHAVDPKANLVGPNVLNWDATCLSGCSFTQGHGWTDQMRLTYLAQYGVNPPFATWGIHLYALDWYNTPMDSAADIASDEAEMGAFSAYLTNLRLTQPIWLSEFGIVWAYPGWTVVPTGCAAPPVCIAPVGSYDQAGVTAFLTTFVHWLEGNRRVERWFLFSNSPYADTFATAPGGISLLTNPSTTALPSASGTTYQSLANGG